MIDLEVTTSFDDDEGGRIDRLGPISISRF
jgi:hypothetical protein